MTSQNTIWISHQHGADYRFHDEHPFNQNRIIMTHDLLQEIDGIKPSLIIPSRAATENELQRIHKPEYIETVKALSAFHPDAKTLKMAAEFGLSDGDTPFFPGMHEAACYAAGNTIEALERVMTGRSEHALNLTGGLHHAFPNRAAGFCIYNDAAVAIAALKTRYPDVKVLYIDTDVHHGDGVQWCFYDDPGVFTFSIHETGKYLFPGTGGVDERGIDQGFGYSLNMPIEPYTEDASWLACFSDILEQVLHAFKPDIIISQHGCDAHTFDPLAHLRCSMRIYREMPQLIHQAAHDYCAGRWVALGGGGYDIWRVVPRAWSLLWLEMCNHPLLAELDSNPTLELPQQWLQRWNKKSPMKLPDTWLDATDDWEPIPRRAQINEINRKMKSVASVYIQ